jgi:glutamate-ammonia-ligase adenylyltransferase
MNRKSFPPSALAGLPSSLRARVKERIAPFEAAGGMPAPCRKGAAATALKSAPRVFAGSDFVSGTCLAQPEVLADLCATGDLLRRRTKDGLAADLARETARSGGDVAIALRRFRLREAVGLAWRDLAGWADLAEVMETMSALAGVCIEAALSAAFAELSAKHGTPRFNGQPFTMTVLGLGKLGGRELNFSSDIDLIFCYAHDGETAGSRPLSHQEFFTRLGQRLIRLLDEASAEGRVFRVDMRLRPNGDSGPLTLSFDAMEHYYQTHGRDWERYALIKARVVAGDIAGGNALLERLRPFVFRRYLDYGAFAAIRDMKRLIEADLERKGAAQNIKLGWGGIREIEFIAQSFQLIRGGREPPLQSNQLLPTLEYLGRTGGMVPEQAVAELIEAYTFLRNAEHRLQMVADEQTQRLPEDEEGRARLAFAMGFADWLAFSARLDLLRRRVQGYFREVFRAEVPGATPADALSQWWQQLGDGREADPEPLRAARYTQPERVLEPLRALKTGRAYAAHSRFGRERVDQVLPLLIRAAGETATPEDTLIRLLDIVETIGRRSAYLALLKENPPVLGQLVRLAAASPWVAVWIAQHPVLLDELLDPVSADAGSSRETIHAEFVERLVQHDTEDLELLMEALRELRHAHVLRVAAADVSGMIEAEEVGRRLSTVAGVVLQQVIAFAQESLEATLGRPTSAHAGTPVYFGVAGYGKLGSRELGYRSDLDLVFLHQGADPQGNTIGGGRSVSNEQYFARLVQRITHLLATRTPSGVLYEIDTRLRPSGGAGTLVVSLPAFAQYQRERAWTWEHQALVRARLVAGGPEMEKRFEAVRREVLCLPRNETKLALDVREMRERMHAAHAADRHGAALELKRGRGGMIDIEFIAQYGVLRHAHQHPALTGPRANVEILELLARRGLLDEADAKALIGAYRLYLTADHHQKLYGHVPSETLAEAERLRGRVREIWERVLPQSAAARRSP